MFTETVKLAGVVPVAGVTLSQLLPDVTAALTLVELAGDVPILKVCDAGAALPGV